MNSTRTYLIRVLRRLESRLVAEGLHSEAAAINRVGGQLAKTANLQSELDSLFAVDGLEQLALGLMWLGSKERIPLNGLQEDVVSFEVEMLRRIFLADPEDEDEDSAPGQSHQKPGTLHDTLLEFSRLVADLRRRLTGGGRFHGFSEELAWRILDKMSSLRTSALIKGNTDVIRFCEAMAGFLEYVVRNRIFSDIRVLKIIDNANLTLQTVVGGEIPEGKGSLEQTIELLKHPSSFLGQ